MNPRSRLKAANPLNLLCKNNLLVSWSGCSDPCHVEWVRSYLSIWTELQAFIKQHHTTGLVWSKTVSRNFTFKRSEIFE